MSENFELDCESCIVHVVNAPDSVLRKEDRIARNAVIFAGLRLKARENRAAIPLGIKIPPHF